MEIKTLQLIDSHCHLDLYPNIEETVLKAAAANVGIIAVTNTPSVFFHTQELASRFASVEASLGLHPQLVATRKQELPLLIENLPYTKFIGEVGLDYQTQDEPDRELQRRTFSEILDRCAEFGDKIFTIHSRRSSADVIDMIGTGYSGHCILHWFSGALKDLDRAVKNGLYFSINPMMTRSKSGQKIIERIPHDRVLVESDGPLVKNESRPAIPNDIGIVVDFLVNSWSLSVSQVKKRIHTNYEAIGFW